MLKKLKELEYSTHIKNHQMALIIFKDHTFVHSLLYFFLFHYRQYLMKGHLPSVKTDLIFTMGVYVGAEKNNVSHPLDNLCIKT